jgi:hypothetical protein
MTDMLLSIDIINGANDGVIKTFRRDLIEPLRVQIAALEARVAALEARGELKYLGIWQPDQTYQRGNFCTLGGALWHAEMRKPRADPEGDSTWKFAVKSAGR